MTGIFTESRGIREIHTGLSTVNVLELFTVEAQKIQLKSSPKSPKIPSSRGVKA